MITIYGHSDDLVEIEGSFCCSGEIDCFGSDVIIAFEDGTKIRVGFSKPGMGGIWYVLIEEKGTAAMLLDICEDPDDDPHSDIFHIDSEIKCIDFDKQQKGREMWLRQQAEKELEVDDIEDKDDDIVDSEEGLNIPEEPEIITYNKLVRDRIPEIIQKSGDTCDIQTLPPFYFKKKLKEKLDEEIKEYKESEDVEEIADIIEVLYALASAYGYSQYDIERIREKKLKERGGFEHRILLKSVLKEKKEEK